MNRYDDLDGMPLYKFLKRVKQFTIFLLVLFFIFSSASIFLVLYLQSQPLPNSTIEQTTFIYSEDGQIIDDLHNGENRVYVPLSRIPKSLIDATIAIEDRKFYKHFGLDFLRIGGAILEDIKHMSKIQGASTITQQLAKNLYLTQEKTWTRKVKEALFAIQLELAYSKDKILEMYLNQIYFGFSSNGVQIASETYYGKDVSTLNLAESSMLAGIIKGPGYYSPFIDMDSAKNRQKQVLQAMVEQKYITQDEATTAYNKQLVFRDPKEKAYQTMAPYFRDYIISLLKNRYGIDEKQIYQGGLKIYTTLNSKDQQYAEQIISKHLTDKEDMQAALISIEPNTGFVKAFVGGKDYKESQYNRVFAKRQPGSTFKPILYLAALENGFTPITMLKDEPTVFTFGNNQTYQPSNFGNHYTNRDIDLRYALTHSVNIYAVKTHMEIGMDKLIDMSKRVGIEEELKPYPSLAIGAQEVTPFEMASAYATIANQGKRIESTAVLKIEDANGSILYKKGSIEEKQVVSPAISFILTYLMEGVFEPGGTGYYVSDRLKRPIAGKTGTTDYDSWLIGYTPHLVTALWTGYDKSKTLSNGDSIITKEIWADYMEKAHSSLPPQLFTVPKGVVSLYIDTETGKIATANCPSTRLEVFIEGTEPTEYCDVHLDNNMKDNPKTKIEDNSSSLWSMFKYWWNN